MQELLDAITDPTRREILAMLAGGERTAGEIAIQFSTSRPGVSRHLRVLHEAGLVTVRSDAQRRIYTLDAAPLATLDAWLHPYRRFWAQRLDALDTEVARGKRLRAGTRGGRPGPASQADDVRANKRSLIIMATRPTASATDLLGVLRRTGEHVDVRLEHRYETDAPDLWAAITEPDRLDRWFATVDGDLREGGRFRVRFSSDDDPDQQADGTIKTCRPPESLELTWELRDQPMTTVQVLITPDGAAASRLRLEHRGMDPAAAVGYGAGWQAYLEALAADLRGALGAGDQWTARWEALLPAYQAQLDAS